MMFMKKYFAVAASVLFLLFSVATLPGDNFARQRKNMVSGIREMVYDTRDYTGRAELSGHVYAAMEKVPRHEFIPADMRQNSYLNSPLPIGHDQTISQPYIVALMTDLANVDKNSVVLEVGTGSGYQAAVLAELARHVYTIEIVEALGTRARKTLQRLGYDNVTVRIGDGYHGWAEHAPYDAILVTAAAEHIPTPLLEQLKPGGTLVIPLGREYSAQALTLVEKKKDGGMVQREILPVGFVPLTGEH
jgi:protein-L-isoaspartate(D-aspartate) O-methyltransferase